MQSLIDGLSGADIRLDPFPHIVVQQAMPAAQYDELAASFPPLERLTWAGVEKRLPNNRRFALAADSILAADDLPASWKSFAERHSSPSFLAGIAALLEGYWDPALLAALGGDIRGQPAARINLSGTPAPEIKILQDARIEVNTPVLGKASSVRGPHLDTPNRLFSGLFYLRAPEDDSEGGDLVLYRWRQAPPPRLDVHEFPPDAVEEAVRIPYRANQLVLFPQNIHALHGVSARQPTPHVRRYVFITAELTEDWLKAPMADSAA
jgi:hypothetical protein